MFCSIFVLFLSPKFACISVCLYHKRDFGEIPIVESKANWHILDGWLWANFSQRARLTLMISFSMWEGFFFPFGFWIVENYFVTFECQIFLFLSLLFLMLFLILIYLWLIKIFAEFWFQSHYCLHRYDIYFTDANVRARSI